MGTSRNDPSPDTPPWRIALSILGRNDILPERQMQQLWRSASADRDESLIQDFTSPVLAEACRIADQRLKVVDAINEFNRIADEKYESGLAIDMGRRALARITGFGGDSKDFVGELFSEASSYYASRDLPSVVGIEGRPSTASELIELKNNIRNKTKQLVRQAEAPRYDSNNWSHYIKVVIDLLKGMGSTR